MLRQYTRQMPRAGARRQARAPRSRQNSRRWRDGRMALPPGAEIMRVGQLPRTPACAGRPLPVPAIPRRPQAWAGLRGISACRGHSCVPWRVGIPVTGQTASCAGTAFPALPFPANRRRSMPCGAFIMPGDIPCAPVVPMMVRTTSRRAPWPARPAIPCKPQAKPSVPRAFRASPRWGMQLPSGRHGTSHPAIPRKPRAVLRAFPHAKGIPGVPTIGHATSQWAAGYFHPHLPRKPRARLACGAFRQAGTFPTHPDGWASPWRDKQLPVLARHAPAPSFPANHG